MKDLSKYISEKLIINKKYDISINVVDKLYELLDENYTHENCLTYRSKVNISIGSMYIYMCDEWFKNYVNDVHKFTNEMFNDYKKRGYPIEVEGKNIIAVKKFDDFSDRDKDTVVDLLNELKPDVLTIQPDYTQTFNVYYKKGDYLIVALVNMDDYMKSVRKVDSILVVIY